MPTHLPQNVISLSEKFNHIRVFQDRVHAGEIVAGMLEAYCRSDAIVMAIPAGGVPVAKVIAAKLDLPLDMAVVSKITLPWNTEAGYGAIAFDGTVRLNDELVERTGLAKNEVELGIEKTSRKVVRRVTELCGNRALPDLTSRAVILVDDGIASGLTMRVGVEALRKAGAKHLIVAVPTGHENSVNDLAREVEAIYCANIRSGWSFAVADAYQRWSDVSEEELRVLLASTPES